MKKAFILMGLLFFSGLGFTTDFQLATFDDISQWGASADKISQETTEFTEGTGSMRVDYTNYTHDAIYLNKPVSLDLSAHVDAGGYMSIDMWVYAGDETVPRIHVIQFETGYLDYYYYEFPLNQTWNAGWNTITVPLSSFTARNDHGTLSLSDITQLKLQTST